MYLYFNNTKVFRARFAWDTLYLEKKIEVLLLHQKEQSTWTATY